MNRRTSPTNEPRRGRSRIESELSDLGRWVRSLREHRRLTRPEAAGLLHISYELLKKIEHGTAACTPPVLEQMITTYGLDLAQARHSRDLAEPAIPLAPVEELRTGPCAGDHLATLSRLDERSLVGAYIDPLWNVVYANDHFRAEVPGIDRYENNLALWFFHPGTSVHTAEPLVVQWDKVAAYLAASLRAAFGIYRKAPQARILYQKLRGSVPFTMLWDNTLAVAYGYNTEEPLQLREPDTGKPYWVRIHLGVKGRRHLGTGDTSALRFCISYRDPCDPPTQL
ncbi:helix-turn-helix domain-containing protein [Nocardia vulneris]|uniref:helix-turn-helix domain-containing protein n=1 Tax=Nocardia vulneris TaxID=1141657 RepID=UPI0030D04087